jgi:3-oxoacyl-[acyl-carrier protein] reductase
MLLKGEVALVTGAVGGLGRATAECLLAQGAKVSVNDLSPPAVAALSARLKKAGGEVLEAPGDVTVQADCESICLRTVERFGRLDILVNAAGSREDAAFTELSGPEWTRVIETNLNGVFYCNKAAQTFMVPAGQGKIINIGADIGGLFGRGQSHYLAAGYGVQGMTKAMALELGPYNINVNCIVPDFIYTEMTRRVAKIHDMYVNELRNTAAALVPMRRLGTAEDVANLVLFLASEKSDFITGQIIHIKGGP